MAVKIKSRYVVKPAEPTPNGKFPLSELDQVAIITYSSHLHFYEKPTQDWLDPSENKIINTLKHSLSRTLVPFYTVAGRLRPIRGGRFELDLSAKGAELIDAECDIKLIDFGEFHSSSHMFRDLLPEIDYEETPIQDLPLLAVQVTQFKCGGLSFGMSTSHVLMDGRSAFHFVKEWARTALGKPIDVPPFLDRRVLRAQLVENSSTFLDYNDELVKCSYRKFYLDEAEKVGFGNKVTPTFVRFEKSDIENLVKIANNNNINNIEMLGNQHRRPYSRFEVIASYLWKCVTKAREINIKEETTLFACVDSRGRLEPPLPSSYFGNAIVDTRTSTEAGKLTSKPLSYACSKIRHAIEEVTSEYVFENIEFLKMQQCLAKYRYFEDRGKIQGPSHGNNNVMVISWLNLPNPGVDFGWGKDIYTGLPIVYACDGDIMIYPCQKDGSIVAGVALQPKEKLFHCLSCPVE